MTKKMENDTILKEIEKNKADKYVSEIELEDFKERYAEELSTKYGRYITEKNIHNISYKRHKPFNVRFREIINKIKIVLGFGKENTNS